jgi:hypothetical protein
MSFEQGSEVLLLLPDPCRPIIFAGDTDISCDAFIVTSVEWFCHSFHVPSSDAYRDMTVQLDTDWRPEYPLPFLWEDK